MILQEMGNIAERSVFVAGYPNKFLQLLPGFMDLNLDLLSRNDEMITVALNHYYQLTAPDPLLG
jgi:hypothetical protein